MSEIRVNMTFDGFMHETAAGDFVMSAGTQPDVKILIMPLSAKMTVEGAALLADKIRERFAATGAFLEQPDDDPPGGLISDRLCA